MTLGQLKEEEKAKLKAEYEVYELKRTLQRELLKQEETVKRSQEEVHNLHVTFLRYRSCKLPLEALTIARRTSTRKKPKAKPSKNFLTISTAKNP